MGKNNLAIFLAGIILALVLLLPRFLSSNPPEKPSSQAWIGCPFFVDENQNGICDALESFLGQTETTEFDFSFSKEFIIFILLLAAAIFVDLKKPKNLPVFRLVLLASSLLYFGFLLHQSLCPIATLQMVFVQKERVVLPIFIFLFFLLPIIATFFFGRIFCQFLCPIGAVQELLFRIPRKFFKIRTFHFPRFFFYLPFLILVLVAFGSFFFSTPVFCRLDPFGFLFGCNPAGWKIPILTVLLANSLFLFRPFCNFLCPLGAIFKLLEKFRIWQPSNQHF